MSLVKPHEAAAEVGRSEQNIRDLVRSGKIRGFVPLSGRGLRVDLDEVRAYVTSQRNAPRYGKNARIVTLNAFS